MILTQLPSWVYKIGHQGGTMVTQLWVHNRSLMDGAWSHHPTRCHGSSDHPSVFTNNVRQVPPLILGFLFGVGIRQAQNNQPWV